MCNRVVSTYAILVLVCDKILISLVIHDHLVALVVHDHLFANNSNINSTPTISFSY
jgi:hypothetical protein